jgi:purine-binding chemotaxis protein CheW
MTGLLNRLAEVRGAFDGVFAQPLRQARDEEENLLAFRVGREPYAVRLDQLAGLFADRPVTPLPDAPPGLLGLAGLRGALMPVYDLRITLGQSGSGTPRWMLVAAGETPVAFAFNTLDGHLRVPVPARSGPGAAETRDVLRTGDELRSVLDLTELIDRIRANCAGTPGPKGENP